MSTKWKQEGLEALGCTIDEVAIKLTGVIVRLDEAGRDLLKASGPWDAAEKQMERAYTALDAAYQVIAQIQNTLQSDIDAEIAKKKKKPGGHSKASPRP